MQLTVPYYDIGNVKRFSVLFLKSLVKKTIECRIIVNDIKAKPIGIVRMPDKSFRTFLSLAHEIDLLQKKELKTVEECIRYTSNTLNSLKH